MKKVFTVFTVLTLMLCMLFTASVQAETKLHIYSNGYEGSQTFKDSSYQNHIISPIGGAHNTYEKVHKYSSVGLDGNGDMLSIPASSDWNFSGDFTISIIFRTKSLSNHQILIGTWGSDNTKRWQLTLNPSGGIDFWYTLPTGGYTKKSSPDSVISVGVWYRATVSRQNGVLRIYKNTILQNSVTVTTAIESTTNLTIGGRELDSVFWVNGYIDNVFISDEYIPVGEVPHQPKAVLWLYSEGDEGTTNITNKALDSTVSHPVSIAGTIVNTLEERFSVGSSFKYPPSGVTTPSYLELPASDDWKFGTGDFTLSVKVYPTVLTGDTRTLFNTWGDVWGVDEGGRYSFSISSDGKLQFHFSYLTPYSWYTLTSSAGVVVINEWQLISIVRKNNILSMYVNDTQVYTLDTVWFFGAPVRIESLNNLRIGRANSNGAQQFRGYMDDIIVAKEAIDIPKLLDSASAPIEPAAEPIQIVSVATDTEHTVAIDSTGTVVAAGLNTSGQCNVSSWTNVKQVETGSIHSIGLKFDGTVVGAGPTNRLIGIENWTDIVQVAAGGAHTVGLKSDGTVVATGDNSLGQCDVSSWTGIIQISAYYNYTVGLKIDGTVIVAGGNIFDYMDPYTWSVDGWNDIIQVSAGAYHIVGLKSDGTVITTGWNVCGILNVSEWTNVTKIVTGRYQTIALKSDGTAVCTGANGTGVCDVSVWSNLVDVAIGYNYSIGVDNTGEVFVAGANANADLTTVDAWNLLYLYYE